MPAKSRPFFLALGLLLFIFALAVLPAPLCAQSSRWSQTGTGSWFTSGNWNAGVPTASTFAAIGNGGTSQIADGGAAVAIDLTLGANTGAGTLEITNGSLTVTGNGTGSSIVLALSTGGGAGNLLVSGTNASLVHSNLLYFNVGDGASGTMTIRDGGLVSGSTSRGLTIGDPAGSAGVVNLEGTAAARGVLATNFVQRGSGTAQFNFDGGILRALGTSSNFLQNFQAGDIVIKAGGAFIDSNGFDLGISSVLSGNGGLTKSGLGTLTLTGNNTYGGATRVTSGTLAINSGGSLIDSGNLLMNSATGQTAVFNVGAGGYADVNNVTLGEQSDSNTVVNVSGSGARLLANIFTFSTGTSTLNVSNGGKVEGDILSLAVPFASNAQMTISGTGSEVSAREVNVGVQRLGTANVVNGGAFTVDSGSGTVLLGQTVTGTGVLNVGTGGAAGIINASEITTGSGRGQVNFNHTGALAFAPKLTGSLSVAKLGSGTTTLTNANTYTGGTRLEQGTLLLGHATALGTGTLTMANATTLGRTITNLFIDNALVLEGDATFAGTGFGGSFLFTNSVLLTDGTHRISAVGTGNPRFEGTVSGNGGLTLTSGAMLQLYGQGTYTGLTTIENGGFLDALSAGNAIVGDVVVDTGGILAIGNEDIADTSSVTVNGTMRLRGATETLGALYGNGLVRSDGSSSSTLAVGSGSFSGTISDSTDTLTLRKVTSGTLALSGSSSYHGGTFVDAGVLSISQNANLGASSGRLTLNSGTLNTTASFDSARLVTVNSASSAFDVSTGTLGLSGVISGTGGLNKLGAGTLSLTGTNTYSGATTVSAGRLNLNGANNGGGAVTVQNGAALGGSGSITGAVTIEDGGILAPGNSAGTLRVGSLILNATSDLQFELGTTSDLVVVAGNLTLDGVLNVTDLAGYGYGTYTLFQYGGSLLDNGITFDLMPPGYGYAIDLSVDGLVRLSVFSPDQYWDGPNTTPDGTVTGGSGTWNNTNTNWTTASGSANFAWNTSGTAIFSGTAGTVTLGETINVSEMVFDTDGYAITGPNDLAISGTTLRISTGSNITALIDATISGTGGLVKTGTGGALILTGSNTYTGGTTIATGTLQLGNGGTTGSILGDVANDGTLAFNRTDEVTFDGIISGTGNVVVNQTGTLALTGSSSYSGGTTLANGTLLLGDDFALGTGAVQLGAGTTFGVVSGGTVFLDNDVTVAGDVNISLADFGFIQLGGQVDLGAATRTLTFTEDFSQACFMGEITGAGGLRLVMADGLSGLVSFCGPDDNTYTGLTTVGDGMELSLEKDPGRIAIAGDLQVDFGGALTLFDTSEQINPASTVTINGIMGIVAFSGTTTQTIGNLQGTGAIVNGFGPAVITVNQGNFAGSILDGGADPLALVKATSGTLTLSNANGYRGGTTINAGRLRTLDSSALGDGPVALAGGSLAPVGELSITSLNWTGGTIASVLGTTTSFVNISGDLTLAATGQFEFTVDGGFLANNPYAILRAANLVDFDEADFAGTTLFGLAAKFTIMGDTLYVSFDGVSDGEIIQNGPPTFTPETANFIVEGEASTADPTESNIVNSLIFLPGSSLRVFNGLTVTGGNLFVQSGSSTITGGTIVAPGTFTKLGGGLLNLLTNVFVGGNAFINEGILAVNGNFTAQSLFVQLNAMLKGAGTIFGNVVNNGVVAPGNSPGTLTVNGNFTQSSSGALEIEVASPTNFDRLIVSGQASLAGALQVVSFDGYQFQFGDQFAFLQAGSIVGTFDSITVPNPSIFRGRFLAEDGTGSIVIAPASYTLVAQTTNQTNVAQALNSYIPATSGDRLAVSTALDLLTIQEYSAAFDQIAPTYYESLGNITIEQAFAQTQQIYQRLSAVRLGARGFQSMGVESVLMHDKNGRSVLDAKDGKDILSPAPDNKWGVWTMGNGLFGRVTNVSQVPNYNFNSGGFLVGGDYRWSEKFVTGVFGGYQYTWADAGDSGNTQINSALFGGYASYADGGFTADAVVGGGYNGYRVRRGIDFGTVDRLAKSQPSGGQFSAALNLGYDWQVGKFTFGPIIGGQYTYAGIAGFTENGADSLDLAVGQQNVNSLRTTLGGRVAYTWNVTSQISLIPEVRMFWQHEFLNNPRNISSSLDGGSGPTFGYETSTPARDSVFAGAGVSAQFGDRWNAFFYYNVDFGRQDYLGNSISGGLNWKF